MRIVLVADRDLPAEGDCSRDPRVLVAGLRDLGHEVTLLPLADGGPPGEDGEQPRATGPDEAISPVPTRARQGLARLTVPPDAILGMGPAAPVTSAVLADSLGVPLLLLLPSDFFGQDPPAPGYLRLVCRRLPSSCLLVESERQSRAAVRHGADPHRVFVVPPGVRLAPFAPRVEDGARREAPSSRRLRVFCDVSAIDLDDQRFVAALLDRLGTERRRRVHAVVLAAGEERPGPADDIWSGRDATTLVRDRGALPALHADSDVVLVPSASGRGTLPALRALAAGRPLVAADCPQNRDVVSSVRHGVLAQPGRRDEWLDKLDYLLTEPSVRSHIGRSARSHAEVRFALPHALGRIEECLTAAVAAWRYVPTNDPWTQGEGS
ncbi:glycosyltransferase [Streptomyces sp. 3MP-14]|uniref:Glycosyltransferase n=1 Tax=Streptomyces mimosae TaxID=2586635 RepID=A0A5N6A2Z8_9ACTN|nr:MULTISPECIES: glycosyltransferase family 4 protein [Streptomyces]KAB8161728.1 glycosyltransferase [Streptomyces mimosae]KAB8175004.1 glycosyltransferase [Streptomyces sp. 3MP-14]